MNHVVGQRLDHYAECGGAAEMPFKFLFVFVSRVVRSLRGLGKSRRADAVLQELQPTSLVDTTIQRRHYEETVGGRGRLH